MPQRIQLSRTKGWRIPANTVKVDRATKWGNPFRLPGGARPQEVVDLYRHQLCVRGHVTNRTAHGAQRVTVDDVRRELRGKNLACWCKPGAPCHADVLLEIANE